MSDDYTGCAECGAAQWSCGCWKGEAAKYTAGAQEGQDRLDYLRRERDQEQRHG